MTDPNFKSTISLRNYLLADPLTVTPVLYLSNGRRFTLDPVKLEPAGVATVSVNDALQRQNVSPWATLSGYIEIDYTWPWDALCATVSNVDVAHSLIFTYALAPWHEADANSPNRPQTIEGIWWKQEREVDGFVALSNLTTQALTADVQILDNQGLAVGQHTITVSPHGTKTLWAQEVTMATSSQGGIRISYIGPQGSLRATGGLEDQSTGYSASMPFAPDRFMRKHDPGITYAEIGLMTGAADPMMSFPAGTAFAPYSVLRNPDKMPAKLVPSLYWMDGGSAHSAQLQAFTIPPNGTVSFDLVSALAKAGAKPINGVVNLQFYVPDASPALLMASGSVDNSHSYVFEVKPQGVIESTARPIGNWSTANGDDTMITVWNPADEAQHLALTLFFSGGHYKLPLDLEARATRTLNLSEIIESQMPDGEGNVIPVSIHEGSAMLSGSQAENEHILVAVDAGVYNVRKATCHTICIDCPGAEDSFITDNPFAVEVNGQHQLTLTVQMASGTQSNETSSATWQSNNGNATVATGLVHGVSAGSAMITGFINVPVNGEVCSMAPQCTATVEDSPTSSGNIGPYQVEPIATASQFPASCPSGQAGWNRNVTNQVQYADGSAYAVSGITVADTISVTSKHDLGSGTSTGSATTTGDGSFSDNYSVCSTACPGTGETEALQYWTAGSYPLPHANTLVYKCSSITIDGN